MPDIDTDVPTNWKVVDDEFVFVYMVCLSMQ